MNTLAEDKFAEFIARKMDEREKKFVMNKKLEVTALPEFASLFKQSRYKSRKQNANHQNRWKWQIL